MFGGGLSKPFKPLGSHLLPKPIALDCMINEVGSKFASALCFDSELGKRKDFDRLQGVPSSFVAVIKRSLGC